MKICTGNGDDHCCYVKNEPCPHLLENVVPGRRWACALFVKYGDWALVHASPEYAVVPLPRWNEIDMAHCGDWEPKPNQCCQVGR